VGRLLGAGSRTVLVGTDTRTTSPLLAHAITAGALSSGGSVLAAGIAPTPAVAWATPPEGSGCMVTASHNPEEYNGLKLFNHGGSSFSRRQQEEVEHALGQGAPAVPGASWEAFTEQRPCDVLGPYVQAIQRDIGETAPLPVVLDCGNGAGSLATPALLRELGMTVSCVNCNPSGTFARPSEPLEEHLGFVGSLVRCRGASGALVHDGDADRLAAFDSRGRMIPGDRLLILFTRYLGARRVVTTLDASMAIEEWAEVKRTPVGDAYVSAALTRWGDFGGEPSGAWIFPRHSLCPDGPYAAALFCRMASEWDIPAEVDAIPSYPLVRRSIPCPQAREVMQALGAESPTDGIRIADDDGWFLVRASGTEPKIRITAEGRTREAAGQMMEKGLSMVRKGKKG